MLVTHQLQYLHEVNSIVVMNMGHIQLQGNFETIKSTLNNSNYFHNYENLHRNENDTQKVSDQTVEKVCTLNLFV